MSRISGFKLRISRRIRKEEKICSNHILYGPGRFDFSNKNSTLYLNLNLICIPSKISRLADCNIWDPADYPISDKLWTSIQKPIQQYNCGRGIAQSLFYQPKSRSAISSTHSLIGPLYSVANSKLDLSARSPQDSAHTH